MNPQCRYEHLILLDILVIDDDDVKLCELLCEYLARFNYEVLTAHDSTSGLARIKLSQPDLVVLDVMIPQVDGFEVLREIRKSSALPVIMLTARGELSDKVVGLELGADDYLAKPFEPRELVARIQTVLRRTQYRWRAYGPRFWRPRYRSGRPFGGTQWRAVATHYHGVRSAGVDRRPARKSAES